MKEEKKRSGGNPVFRKNHPVVLNSGALGLTYGRMPQNPLVRNLVAVGLACTIGILVGACNGEMDFDDDEWNEKVSIARYYVETVTTYNSGTTDYRSEQAFAINGRNYGGGAIFEDYGTESHLWFDKPNMEFENALIFSVLLRREGATNPMLLSMTPICNGKEQLRHYDETGFLPVGETYADADYTLSYKCIMRTNNSWMLPGWGSCPHGRCLDPETERNCSCPDDARLQGEMCHYDQSIRVPVRHCTMDTCGEVYTYGRCPRGYKREDSGIVNDYITCVKKPTPAECDW
jgi:hypothetical protein